MFKKTYLIAFFLAMGSANASEDSLTSPYFIDGIHCTGLAEHDGPAYLLIPESETKTQKLIEAQEDCIDLFKSFGIEKYNWISPEDLERISAQVSQSVYFESALLSIKKSELKNHIHVFLNVKTKSKYVYSFATKTKVYSILNNPRFFNRLSGEVLDRSLQPNSNDSWGFILDTGLASRPVSKFDSNTGQTFFSDQVYNKNYYFTELYYNHHRIIGQSWTWGLIGRINADNIYVEKTAEISGSLDSDLIYSKYFRFLHGSLFGGAAVILTPDFGYLASLYTENDGGNFDVPIILPGFKIGYLFGRGVGTYFRTELAGYRAFYGSKSIIEWKSLLQFDLGKGYLINSIFNGKQTHNLILPRDRAPSTDAMSNNASLSLIKVLGPELNRREVEFRFGFEKLNYTKNQWISGSTPFFQTGYRILNDTWNLDFSLTYLGTRIY
jgi:hypothetical protein